MYLQVLLKTDGIQSVIHFCNTIRSVKLMIKIILVIYFLEKKENKKKKTKNREVKIFIKNIYQTTYLYYKYDDLHFRLVYFEIF